MLELGIRTRSVCNYVDVEMNLTRKTKHLYLFYLKTDFELKKLDSRKNVYHGFMALSEVSCNQDLLREMYFETQHI